MKKLKVFNFITLDGYFAGAEKDISWHRHDEETNAYAHDMLSLDDTLLFGRVTYDLMASYWPTPFAIKNDPIMAERMNNADKIVFSQTLKKTEWINTSIVHDNIVDELHKLKQIPGKNMTILGSGSIVTQLAQSGLIDEYQIMVDPVILGGGTSICKGINHVLNLKLTSTRTFRNGNVLLCYLPVEQASDHH